MRSKGFTLIKLVVVIVILGILAAIATPKILNLQSDARAAQVDGLKAALADGTSLVYNKAVINGQHLHSHMYLDDGLATPNAIYVDGIMLMLQYGAPALAPATSMCRSPRLSTPT